MLKKTIGDILFQLQKITQVQLSEALDENRVSGEDVGDILLKKGVINKSDLAKARAEQMSLPFIEKITDKMINTDMLGSIQLKFLREHAVIPIMQEGKKTIVTSNPQDLEPLDNLA